MSKRTIAVIIGSDSDLPQCEAGLRLLHNAMARGEVVVGPFVYTASIHRNTDEVIEILKALAPSVDVIITAAGWANHLTGTCDAYLRYGLNNDHVVVVGVAFDDPDSAAHTEAAKLSISEVPGTQVVFRDEQGKQFVGPEGFANACRFAISGVLPTIKLPKLRATQRRSLDDVFALIYQQKQT